MAKRHWVTTLLAVWMFADAVMMLLWEADQLYGLWDFHDRPPHQPPVRMGPFGPRMWVLVILYYFRVLLMLFPTPHFFLDVLRQIPWAERKYWMHTYPVYTLLNLAVVGVALALGYGLLRMREWARWSYAGLCVLTIVAFGAGRVGFYPLLAVFWLLAGFILPIALLVFLIRRGLSVPPRDGSLSPAASAGHSSK